MKNWWPSRNSWFTHEFHGGFPWFTMVMNQFTRGPLFIDRDGHKVGRPVVVQTYQKHPTDSNGLQRIKIFCHFRKKKHHQTRHHVDWHNPTKKGDRSSYQITPQKKAAIHTPTMTILFIGTYKPAVKDGDPLLLATNESGRNWNHLNHEQNPGWLFFSYRELH